MSNYELALKIATEAHKGQLDKAVKLLTHNKDVPYMDYVAKIKDNELARKVKIADLTHNSELYLT